MKIQVEPDHYVNKNYDSKERFISYWHQISEINQIKAFSIIEIGIGNGFTSDYLKRRGYNLVTMDIDKKLNPDFVGSVHRMPFQEESFDLVACFEVLEHVPFDKFLHAIAEIHRVSKKHAIISLPDCSPQIRFGLQLPKFGMVNKLFTMPQKICKKHEFDGEHYWEIGKAGYSLKKITKCFNDAEFQINETYRIFELPYHRFFILEKQ